MKEINFLGIRYITFAISAILIIITMISLFTQQLNFSIEFTGGTLVEVGYEQAVDLDPIREQLKQAGFEQALVQHFGSSKEVLIRLLPQHVNVSKQALSDEIFAALQTENTEVSLRRVDFIGSQVGKELTETGSLAMLYALIGILIYIAFRFEYRFALGAVIALMHDVLITLGFFSVLQIEFDLSVLAALLAVIGYSLNDTIVVFDRVRENFLKMRKSDAITVMNTSIQKTLSRTLVTSLTTLLVLVALYIYAGDALRGFALALIIGIIVGTYSSIYVASAFALLFGVRRENFLPVETKEDKVSEEP